MIARNREGEIKTDGGGERWRFLSCEREGSNSKVKGGSRSTDNTDSGARGKEGLNGRGSGKKESSTTA